MNPELFMTGSSGFVGSYLRKCWQNKYSIVAFQRQEEVQIESSMVLHLAGIAHDVKDEHDESAYWQVNVELTKRIFDAYLKSQTARVFVFLSSIKAVADSSKRPLSEENVLRPSGIYGTSKAAAEAYIMSQPIPSNKRVYILRPALLHGPGNKGNLALLQAFVKKGLPWPFAAFNNERSFCSIQNLTFILEHLLADASISSGIYHIADDEAFSTNNLIEVIAGVEGKKATYLYVPKNIMRIFSKIGDKIGLPLNTHTLQKLTDSLVVSNRKIKDAIGTQLPWKAEDALRYNLK